MVYKFTQKEFTADVKILELEHNIESHATLSILSNGVTSEFILDESQIYNIIGALHSIQTKIKNFKSK